MSQQEERVEYSKTIQLLLFTSLLLGIYSLLLGLCSLLLAPCFLNIINQETPAVVTARVLIKCLLKAFKIW
ncbi:hypothetical protein ACEN2P_20350, partial [Pedobacter psychrotolerans]|uniref:hypothetical protein n=1 Tax=Pedobacter psychrotolerans TaxID=1843235 RepID=UPI003F955F5B